MQGNKKVSAPAQFDLSGRVAVVTGGAARSMVGHKRGKIINMASMYSFFGCGPAPFYSAAKGGDIPADQVNGY
jgi:NAD(P)-dependent dehydrogenase (short-subunit alcohol dehydrogenase family)